MVIEGLPADISYQHSLKVLLLMVLKLNPAGGAAFPKAFSNLLSLTKSVITYKHSTLAQQMEQGFKVD